MSRSDDGAEWTVIAEATVVMAPTVRVGLAVSGRAARKTLEQFSHTSLTGKLPSGWDTADVGSNPGGATYQAGGRLVVVSAGQGIGGVSDDFRYTFRRVTTDVDIIARVASLRGTNRMSTAGLMIRRSLHPAAANASILVTPRGGITSRGDCWPTRAASIPRGATMELRVAQARTSRQSHRRAALRRRADVDAGWGGHGSTG